MNHGKIWPLMLCCFLKTAFGQQAVIQNPEILVGQLQWIALRPPILPSRTQMVTPGVRDLVRQLQPGGFILFQENLEGPAQLRRFMEELASLCAIPPLFAIDEEGGTVTRLARIESFQFRRRPAAPRWADLGEAAFKVQARELAADLKRLGFRVNLAPVADLNLAVGNPMRYRSFGADPNRVSRWVGWWIASFQEVGVASVVKHFPGLGTTRVDTHRDFVRLDVTKPRWNQQEGAVFRAAIERGAEFLMIAHVAWPDVSGNSETIAFSEAVLTGLVRGELGYRGLLMTDALDMDAITRYQTQSQAALRAVLAGIDIVAMSTQPLEVKAAFLESYAQNSRFRSRAEESAALQLQLKRKLLNGNF